MYAVLLLPYKGRKMVFDRLAKEQLLDQKKKEREEIGCKYTT